MSRMAYKLFLTAFALLLFGTFANAQGLSGSENGKSSPIEITADDALEWRRAENIYVARGNAQAQQGETRINAAILKAHYRDDASGNTSIWKVEAENNVTITSPDGIVKGARGVYLVSEGRAELTGGNLSATGKDDMSVTAEESLQYFTNENKFIATGNAVASEPGRSITGDTLTAWTKADGGGLDRAEADGNVVIKTETETATGNRATYDADTSIAELTGDVKVVQGKNELEGVRATVNLETGVSQMFGEQGGGRVKGLFFPSSE